MAILHVSGESAWSLGGVSDGTGISAPIDVATTNTNYVPVLAPRPTPLRRPMMAIRMRNQTCLVRMESMQMAPVENREQYKAEWIDYRFRRRFAAAMVVAFLPAIFAFEKASEYLFSTDKYFAFVGGAFAALNAVAWLRLALFRCPRCRKFFHSSMYRSSTMTKQCMNCGLHSYAAGADITVSNLTV